MTRSEFRTPTPSLCLSLLVARYSLLLGKRDYDRGSQVFLDGERGTAATGSSRVGVADHKARAHQSLLVVHLRAIQVLNAHGIHQQGDTILFNDGVVIVDGLIEGEAIGKPGTATPVIYTRSFSCGLPSSSRSSLTLAAAASVNEIGAFSVILSLATGDGLARGQKGQRADYVPVPD